MLKKWLRDTTVRDVSTTRYMNRRFSELHSDASKLMARVFERDVVVSTSACHAAGRGSIPRPGASLGV